MKTRENILKEEIEYLEMLKDRAIEINFISLGESLSMKTEQLKEELNKEV